MKNWQVLCATLLCSLYLLFSFVKICMAGGAQRIKVKIIYDSQKMKQKGDQSFYTNIRFQEEIKLCLHYSHIPEYFLRSLMQESSTFKWKLYLSRKKLSPQLNIQPWGSRSSSYLILHSIKHKKLPMRSLEIL